jgi:hypothetical protein
MMHRARRQIDWRGEKRSGILDERRNRGGLSLKKLGRLVEPLSCFYTLAFRKGIGGFDEPRRTLDEEFGFRTDAQVNWVARLPITQEAAGSSPVAPAILIGTRATY